jgi:hypothetical protein
MIAIRRRYRCPGWLRLWRSSGPCVCKKLARLPSLPGNKTGVIPDWVREAKKRRGPRCGNTQGPIAAAGVLASAELDKPAGGPVRVCRTLSLVRGEPALVLCEHAQGCLLLPWLRAGRRSDSLRSVISPSIFLSEPRLSGSRGSSRT